MVNCFSFVLLLWIAHSTALADTLYTIIVDGEPRAIIVERQIDGRSVSLPFFPGKKLPDSQKEWVEQGIENADANFIFEIKCRSK